MFAIAMLSLKRQFNVVLGMEIKMKSLIVIAVLAISMCNMTQAGLLGLGSYGICQTGCNAVWVACVAAAGGTAGVTTGGAAVPAAILACNAAQGVCMASCAAIALSPI